MIPKIAPTPAQAPTASIPTPDEVRLREEEEVMSAEENLKVEKIAEEAGLKAFLVLAITTALTQKQITSKEGGCIAIDNPQIQAMFTRFILADDEYRAQNNYCFTMPNSELEENERLLKKILAEYGWTGKIIETSESAGYSMTTKGGSSKSVYTLHLTPLRKKSRKQ